MNVTTYGFFGLFLLAFVIHLPWPKPPWLVSLIALILILFLLYLFMPPLRI